jgi:hypothetical protein
MMRDFTSTLATAKGRRWLLLCLGFTVAAFQLCGLALVHPSAFNTANVGVIAVFYFLALSLKP